MSSSRRRIGQPDPAESRFDEPRQERVLLVEDEEALRTLLGEVLTRAGYRVVSLRHGAEVEAWRAGPEPAPDLLLVDLHLPGEDGRSLARRLGRAWPGLRVLFMSGYPDEDAEAGGEFLLVKPFRLGELLARVAALLQGAPRG